MAEIDKDLLRAGERQITQLRELDRSAQRFGASLSAAFSRNIGEGQRLESVLLSIGKILLRAALKPIAAALAEGVRGLISANGVPTFAKGGVFSHGRVTPFAAGGVVASPTYFPMAGGVGLMGERGAEAIMPLARGPDGRLGVAAGGAARPTSITVNIATPDVEGFRRSEAQVAAALARAVARGQRGL